ncbi:MAG: hypothetical protein NTW25_00615 [Candidatus Kapabacteria bacterium]|nr:hypothetical protein [Candidatus Kapabacteria bacterium]
MVDMYYRFTSDEEPSEEQLKTLMSEVTIDVIEQSIISKQVLEKLISVALEKAKEENVLGRI